MMRDARPHPRLPFIKVGIFVDPLAFSFGLDYQLGESDTWCYTIEDDAGFPIVRDEETAIRSAEEMLFAARPDVVRKYTDLAIRQQDFELAMALAERQGYWEAVAHQRRVVGQIVREAQCILQPLTL